jgi:uncharacterized membrane protein
MKEFYWWVAIVTLLLFLNLASWMGLAYMDKKLNKAEAIVQRAEQLEKKSKAKLEPKSNKEE